MIHSIILGLLGGTIAGLIIITAWDPPRLQWIRDNPPSDYVWIRNRVRAVRYSRARRRLDEATRSSSLIEQAIETGDELREYNPAMFDTDDLFALQPERTPDMGEHA